MTKTDMPTFNRCFNSLASLYNMVEYEDQRARYYSALSDLDIALIESAFESAASRSGTFGSFLFFPLPGVLRDLSYEHYRSRTSKATPTSCTTCGGTGWERVSTADEAQPTVKRCACRISSKKQKTAK